MRGRVGQPFPGETLGLLKRERLQKWDPNAISSASCLIELFQNFAPLPFPLVVALNPSPDRAP